jgi:hypothetical protein
MAHISGQVRIAAPVERVFDTVAEERRIRAGLRTHMETRGGRPPG